MSAPGLFAEVRGSGPAVVFAHAIGWDHRLWDALAPEFERDFRVIRVDLRGHGRSPAPPGPYTLSQLAGDCAGVLDRLRVERAHFVGLSLGGMVGQAFALEYADRLSRLGLANTTAGYGEGGATLWAQRIRTIREGGLEALLPIFPERSFSEAFRREHPERVALAAQRLLETPPEGYLGCCEAIATLDYLARLSAIRAQTLAITGDADIGTPVSMAKALAEGIPGARLAVIPGAAHLSAWEMPEAFTALVKPFLRDAGRVS